MFMKHVPALFLAGLLIVAAPGCGGGGNAGTGGTSGTGGAGTPACGATASTIVANEANDYTFASTLSFPPVSVTPKTNLMFDWSGATADLVRHPVNPSTDIMMVNLFMWDLTLEDLQSKLNADALTQRDLTVIPATFLPAAGVTSAKLLDFSLNGTPITPDQIQQYFDDTAYPPANHTYTIMVASGTMLGQGTRMIQSFTLDPASSNSSVSVKADSTNLDFSANLHGLQSTLIPVGKSAITLDWSKMKTNALGNTFLLTNITTATVSHYTQTAAGLEGPTFLDLDLIATALYRGAIPSGTVVDFSTLKDASGNTFPGIDAAGTWVVALQCGGCRNPAPWYLSVLKPCSN
jgi:hypothetical protein